MIDKDPINWAWTTWFLVLAMSFSGGLVNWYAKIKQGRIRSFNIIELIGELFISGFVGLSVFMALSSWDQPPGLCAAAAGVSGHMASRLLFLVEKAIEERLKKLTIGDKDEESVTDSI